MIELTDKLARHIAVDIANRRMRKHGRTVWNVDDWNVAAAELARLMEPQVTQPVGKERVAKALLVAAMLACAPAHACSGFAMSLVQEWGNPFLTQEISGSANFIDYFDPYALAINTYTDGIDGPTTWFVPRDRVLAFAWDKGQSCRFYIRYDSDESQYPVAPMPNDRVMSDSFQ